MGRAPTGLIAAASFGETQEDRDVLVLTGQLLALRADPVWSAYMAMLPTDVHLPINYTADELNQLAGSNTLLRLVRQHTAAGISGVAGAPTVAPGKHFHQTADQPW
jgi:hypothetical protein